MLPTPELVSRIRVATGDTQEGLARRMGVSFPTINAWERGRSTPTATHREHLEQIAADFGIRSEVTVLVIDDDPVTAELVRALARGIDKAITVEAAIDGWEGLVKCGSLKPQLVFLDVMMPGIDGLEVAERLPSIDGLEDMRVVFVTASQSSDILSRARKLGNSVIGKPLDLDALATALAAAIDRP